jgi:hypothetical protein
MFYLGLERLVKDQGYFTNDDILDHASTAMDILETHYPGEDHVLIFDNATPVMPCQPEKCPRTSQRMTRTGVWR